jgi:hypothetical protein
MAIIEKICLNCNSSFETKSKQKRYCSIGCQRSGYAAKGVIYNVNPPDLDGEIWKDVVGFSGLYLISNKGRLKSIKKNGTQILRSPSIRFWYLRTSLSNNGKITQESIHRMVAAAFIPNPQNKPVVNHIDANPLNNCVENLEWCTPAENLQHAINLGNLKLRGIHNANSILDETKVREMRRLKNECGLSIKDIATKFNIRTDTATLAINGRNWAWVV